MSVVLPASNHVPVQVRHHVAETAQIDLLGLRDFAHAALDLPHHMHQMLAVGVVQVGHFSRVTVPDHAQEGRMIGIARVDHTQPVVAPQPVVAGRVIADRAVVGHFGHSGWHCATRDGCKGRRAAPRASAAPSAGVRQGFRGACAAPAERGG
jgi:hypothetical protein